MKFKLILFSVALAAAAGFTVSASAAVYGFSGGAISIPEKGTGTPYPSPIFVGGIPPGEKVVEVEVTVANFTHTSPDDAGAVVTNPGGQAVVLFNGPGEQTAPVSGLTWVFDDAAPTALPIVGPLVGGTFRPSNQWPGSFDPPAPAEPYSTSLATLNTGNPNGTWSLYVQDFTVRDAGGIGSWSVRIVTSTAVAPSIALNISGADLILRGTNGAPGSTNFIITATDLALPLSSWTRVATNLFDANGSFAYTLKPARGSSQGFYRLQIP